MYDSFIKPIESVALGIFETAADLFDTGNGKLDRVHLGVELPRDLYSHPDVQTEWWYYTGHCRSESGREFGFELVFFKRRTDHDQIGVIPIRMIANPIYAAHFAMSDLSRASFSYEHRRSFNKPFDIPVRMCEDRYSLMLGDWTVHEDDGAHILQASLKDGTRFDAVLHSVKEPVLNGDGDGLTRKANGTTANHFSLTRMALAGKLSKNGASERFTGSAWMDKEFGTWDQKYWDWFSIQLDNGTELMIYHFRKDNGDTEEHTHAVFIDEEGNSTQFADHEFELKHETNWTSAKTGTTYPSDWTINVPGLSLDLRLTPLMRDQELDTRGTTMVIYWEGCCGVNGSRNGQPVEGRAYAELVGYDRSNETMSLTGFFLGDLVGRINNFF